MKLRVGQSRCPWVLLTLALASPPFCLVCRGQSAALAGTPASSRPPPAETVGQPADYDTLIEQLGAATFGQRQRASRELIAAGPAAMPKLQAALDHPDPEIRRRAREVLNVVWELDFLERLAAFEADAENLQPHDLPGWPRFHEQFGRSEAARRLFASMLRAEPSLIRAAEATPEQAGDMLEARCQQIQEGLRARRLEKGAGVPLGTTAALLFVGSGPGVNVSLQARNHVAYFTYQPSFQSAVTGDTAELASLLRALLSAWLTSAATTDPVAAYQNMMLAIRFSLSEGADAAVTVVRAAGVATNMKQSAVLALAKLGTEKHVAVLEPLLGETDVCAVRQEGGQRVETQLRDVALLAMIRLSGRNPGDFGFTRLRPNSLMVYDATSIGFPSDRQRQEALQAWRSWSQSAADKQPSP